MQSRIQIRSAAAGSRKRYADSSRLWVECARRGLVSDPCIRTALQQLSINPYDTGCAEFIQGWIQSVDIQEILDPDPNRRTNPNGSGAVSGPIRLGKVKHTNVGWGIRPEALTEHLVLIGRTGGGKSTVIKAIISQLLDRK